MGMKRETYERKFKELFAYTTKLVDNEVDKWRDYKIEVRKNEVSPTKFVYVVEWQGQPLNAFALELRKDNGGYPYILLSYDYLTEGIYRLHRNKDEKVSSLILLLHHIIEDTIIAEAERIALKQGFFARIKSGNLFVHIGDYEFQLRYLRSDNSWRVWCNDLHIWEEIYECGNHHPLEFLPNLLKALVLKLLL